MKGSLAKRADRVAGESYRIGRGETLPFEAEWADAILYLKSFHHMPPNAMPQALKEAARVLKSKGQLIAIEPIAQGPYFEAMRLIEDETEVRTAAYSALCTPPPELEAVGELVYETLIRFRDADHFLQAIVAPDPARRDRLPEVETETKQRFATYVRKDGDGFYFLTPMRRHSLRKAR